MFILKILLKTINNFKNIWNQRFLKRTLISYLRCCNNKHVFIKIKMNTWYKNNYLFLHIKFYVINPHNREIKTNRFSSWRKANYQSPSLFPIAQKITSPHGFLAVKQREILLRGFLFSFVSISPYYSHCVETKTT